MTFDEWWYKKGYNYGQEHNRTNMEFVWNAAIAAERQRCREIVDDLGRYADIAEMLEQIGE